MQRRCKEDAKKISFLSAVVFTSIMFAACGLESVNYLPYVDEANVARTTNNHVDVVNLPAGPGHSAIDALSLDFTQSQIPTIQSSSINEFLANFQIYYRIYLSNTLIPGEINTANMNDVNQTLVSDFASLKPYTITSNNYAASVGSAFSSRNYWTMNELSNPYILRSSQLITPYPQDRYFSNDPELKRPEYLNTNNNADVVTNSAGTNYTYVSMYIVHTAFNDTTLTPYYSSPTFLGVFLLPDPINIIVIVWTVTANGSLSPRVPTTALTLTMDRVIPGLSAADIEITYSSPSTGWGIIKGTLTGSGPVYTLPVSGITSESISVALRKSGYSATSQTVNASPEQVNLTAAQFNSATSVTLVFDNPLFGLTNSHLTISGGISPVSVTLADASGTANYGLRYIVTTSAAVTQGTTTVTVNKPDSYLGTATQTIP